jgi:hypothetical protein
MEWIAHDFLLGWVFSGGGQFSGGTTTHQMALGLPLPPNRVQRSM